MFGELWGWQSEVGPLKLSEGKSHEKGPELPAIAVSRGHTGGFPATPCVQSTFTTLHSPACSVTAQLLLEKKMSQLFCCSTGAILNFHSWAIYAWTRPVRSRSNRSWPSWLQRLSSRVEETWELLFYILQGQGPTPGFPYGQAKTKIPGLAICPEIVRPL